MGLKLLEGRPTRDTVNRDWEFVSKGTEVSLGNFVSEYFTPLTLGS
jgi:hypothetical protein